jgi:ketosteroid isomerase-like protein
MLTATGAALALPEGMLAKGGSAEADESSVADPSVAELMQLSLESNTALMCGDINTYRDLLAYTDDFTLMSPFGGTPTRGIDMTSDRWERMGRFFKNGTFKQELVQGYASADIVVLALIERAHVEVGGLPAQDWALRVTLVYRREKSEWRLAHRHADPLVADVSWKQAASLARGERNP